MSLGFKRLISKVKNLATYFSYNEPSLAQTERSLGTFNVCAQSEQTLNVPRIRSVWANDGSL